MKTEVGKATKYCLFCVGEEASQSSSAPSPPSSSFCPSTLGLHCSRHSLKSKHQHVEAGGVASAPSSQGEADGIALTWLTSNLHSEVLGHHAVSGSQISVDKFVGIQVWHAVGYFPCHLDHLFEGGQDLAGGVLWQSEGVKSTGKKQCSVSLSSFSAFHHTQHYNVGDQWQFTPSPISRGKRLHQL